MKNNNYLIKHPVTGLYFTHNNPSGGGFTAETIEDAKRFPGGSDPLTNSRDVCVALARVFRPHNPDAFIVVPEDPAVKFTPYVDAWTREARPAIEPPHIVVGGVPPEAMADYELVNLARPVTEADAWKFCDDVTMKIRDRRQRDGFHSSLLNVRLVYKIGPRWIRVYAAEDGKTPGSIWCIIDPKNGDIFKATSYAGGPAPHARGNIFGDYWGKGIGEYGPVNLR